MLRDAPAYPGAGEPDDAELVGRLAQATALAAEPLLMYQVERHVALTLQHSFLPQPHRLPDLPGVDVVVRYVPASRQTEIGGDFYAALRTDDGVLTAVGDVVGHSLDAATVMVEMRHALRAYCVEEIRSRGARRPARPHAAALPPRGHGHRLPGPRRPGHRAHPDRQRGPHPAADRQRLGQRRVRQGRRAAARLGLGLPRQPPIELFLDPTDRLLMVTDGLIETRGIDLAVSMEELRTAAAEAPPGVSALCDTLLERFGGAPEDDIAMLALRLG